MNKLRGRIEIIDNCEVWFDKYDKSHKLIDMPDEYIENCIQLLEDRIEYGKKFNVDVCNREIDIFKRELLSRSERERTLIGKLIYG